MDIKKYFDNIDKDILFQILKRKITDKKLLRLLQEIIYSNCTKEELENASSKRKGLPIGNYTSQIFANIYLNELDQYIKHSLKGKYYFRYLDDMILLVETKKEAKMCLKKIKELKCLIKNGKINSKEAKKYLAGHIGYIHYANIRNLTKKIFYIMRDKSKGQ